MEYARNAATGDTRDMPVAQPDMSQELRPQRLVQRDSNDDLTLSTNRVVKNQIVFRVRDTRRPAPRTRKPVAVEQDGTSAEQAFHSRRPHRKSRTGCGNCKKRRVKCDEKKPHCNKCESYGISCDYAAVQLHGRRPHHLPEGRRTSTASPTAMIFAMSVTDMASRIQRVLQSSPSYNSEADPLPPFTISGGPMALYHFVHAVQHVASMSDTSRRVSTGDMLRLAFRTPHLMHAVLGLACTSLYQYGVASRQQRLAEAYHWQNAIKLYKHELQNPISIHNMDALMSTCMLMGVLSFSEKEYSPLNSWVFSSRPTDLNWLLVQGGLRYLIESVIPWLPQSIWWNFFLEADDEHKTFDDHRAGFVGLPLDLARLCGIEATTTEETNPYHSVLRLLAPLLPLPLASEHFCKFTSFMGRLQPDYITLLQRKDARACLILSYWMGKMCEQPHWWISPRVHAECTALCMFLERCPDPEVRRLLAFPASKCGYPLGRTQHALMLHELEFGALEPAPEPVVVVEREAVGRLVELE
ncbi:hypothetical protein LOZ58_001567 [Ophidiomyces ophidiicola]|nr:hypothetical protein LOZ65_006346 [Ophidiomyces ophidiicola]KAI1964876.1 hypothetical protein LOZ58_001567 [Ophidiomyces ophidiicola]